MTKREDHWETWYGDYFKANEKKDFFECLKCNTPVRLQSGENGMLCLIQDMKGHVRKCSGFDPEIGPGPYPDPPVPEIPPGYAVLIYYQEYDDVDMQGIYTNREKCIADIRSNEMYWNNDYDDIKPNWEFTNGITLFKLDTWDGITDITSLSGR